MYQNNVKNRIIYPLLYGTLSFLGNIKRSIINKKELFILCYHRVLDIGDEFDFYPDVVTSNIFDFNKQMEYIVENYSVISFRDFHEGDYPDGKPLLIITFDDGYVDFKTNVLPVLRKHNLGATVFVTPEFASNKQVGWWEHLTYAFKTSKKSEFSYPELGLIDCEPKNVSNDVLNGIIEKIKYYETGEREAFISALLGKLEVSIDESELSKSLYLNWDELREISQYKIEYGAHSMTHPILTKVNPVQLREEIHESKAKIEHELDIPVTTFCYPNGRSMDFDENVIEELRKAGYLSAVTMMFGPNIIDNTNLDLYRLKRIPPISSEYLPKQLAATVTSDLLNKFL